MKQGLAQPGRGAARRPRRRNLRRFGRDASGASALEFALVALPFILLLFGVLEVGLVYFANFSLENATAQGARLIRTGQAQTGGYDAARFKTEVCKYLSSPVTCAGLKIDVRHYANFAVGGDVVVVRTFYEWELAAKLPKEIGLSNMNNGDRLLVATAAFRNEPFK
jgi:Flp pilus assembly protein TadG